MVRDFYTKFRQHTLFKTLLLLCSISLGWTAKQVHAQCTVDIWGVYGNLNPVCGGAAATQTCTYGGEYSNVTVTTGNTYTFTATSAISYITITDNVGATIYTFGNSPVVWTATFSGTVRMYTHTSSSCGSWSTDCSQSRSVSCTSPGCTGTPSPGNTISSTVGACVGTPFTLSLQNATLGAGVTYQWQSADDNAFTVNVTALGTASTQTIASQTAAKYYRCTVTCASNSGVSTPVLVTQNAPSGCYCTPVYTTGTTYGDLISQVQIAGTTLLNNSGTTNSTPSWVQYTPPTYTASNYTANLIAGNTYNLIVTIGSFSTQGVAAWIDYNDDGAFASNEKIGATATTINTSFGTGTFPITLACNPTPGQHRMRVRCVWNTNGVSIDPCASYGYGETEDYIVTIDPPLPCPAPSAFASYTPTIDGATFKWNAGCVETDWAIEFGLPGFTPGTGTTFAATNDTTIVNTMNCGTTYDVYVRANCISNGYSTYVGPISVTTLACPCSGTPAVPNALSSSTTPCAGSNFTLSLDNNYSTVTGITYQWESSPAGANTYTTMAGANTNSYTVTGGITANTDYRCLVTCSSSSLSTYSVPVSITLASTPVGNTQADPIVMAFTANAYTHSNNTANCYTSTYTGLNSQSSPDVYYRFVAPNCMDSAVISLCGASWDTYLHLLDSTGTQIANNDDGCSPASIINTNILQSGKTYYIVVEGYAANTGAYTLNVNLYNNPFTVQSTVSPSDIECEGTMMTFVTSHTGNVSLPLSYVWTGGAPVTEATPFAATAAHSATFTVTVTDAGGCTATTTLPILILPAPAITATVNSPICIGQSATFTASSVDVTSPFTWDNGVSDGVPYTPISAGTQLYTVTGTDAFGCQGSTSIPLTVNAPATFNVPVILNATCPTVLGGSVVMSASSPSTFAIAPAGPTQPISGIFNNLMGGTIYTITLTDGNTCTNTSVFTATTPSNGQLAYATSSNTNSLPGNICQTLNQQDGTTQTFYGASCDEVIATVVDATGGNTLGSVNACVTVMPTVPVYQGQPYLPRFYVITPTNQGPADITLYFTQDDFDDYNAAAGAFPTIPANPALGTVTFCISQVPQGFLPGASGASTTVHTVTATWNPALLRWEVTFPVSSFSGFYCHACNPLNSALPAYIANFSGRKQSHSNVLNWTSVSEMNNAHFNLLYSEDGKNYTTIARIASTAENGYSAQPIDYSYEHTTPKLGHNYYQLQQVDLDGKSTIYNELVDLQWGAGNSTVNIYPNPVTTDLHVEVFTNKAVNNVVKVMDLSGRVIVEQATLLNAGANRIQIPMVNLAQGMYTIHVYENNQLIQVQKIQKK